jgi:hypothetical protein
MFGRNQSSNPTPESQGWWPSDRTLDRLSKAGRGALLSIAIVALYHLTMFLVQARNIEKDIRLLPGSVQEWAIGNSGIDISSGPRAIETLRSLLRESGGDSDSDESGWQEEQSTSCELETGCGEGVEPEQRTRSERVNKLPLSNMGASAIEEWRQRRRSRVQGSRRDPKPYVEKPVKIGPSGEIIDPNIVHTE